MARNYAALFHEYLEEMDCLTDEEFGRLCRALIKYSSLNEPIRLTGNERFFAKRVMAHEDAMISIYDSQSESRTEAARSAANARWNMRKDADACERMQTHADECERMRTHTDACEGMRSDANLCVDANSISNSISNSKSISNKEKTSSTDVEDVKEKAPKRFLPPTLEEVRSYCEERGRGVDPERWYDHYTANGWRIGGKSPMRDWRASVRTWEKNGYDRPAQKAQEKEESFDVDDFFQDALRKSYGGGFDYGN